jgi:hypothetical protein
MHKRAFDQGHLLASGPVALFLHSPALSLLLSQGLAEIHRRRNKFGQQYLVSSQRAASVMGHSTSLFVEAVFLREVAAFVGQLTLQKYFQCDVPSGV